MRYIATVAAIEGHCDDVIHTAAAAQICVHANGYWEHKKREQLKHVNKRHHVIGFSANRIATLYSVQLMLVVLQIFASGPRCRWKENELLDN